MIGGNNFLNCIVPIIFEDRYFVLEQEDNQDLFTVFTLHGAKPILEIEQNEPRDNPLTEVSTTSAGFITVGQKGGGDFIYKVRPVYKGSSIFGRIKGDETEIRITDRAIEVGTNRFEQCNVQGREVGIIVHRNGGIGFGASLPPEARHLFRRRE